MPIIPDRDEPHAYQQTPYQQSIYHPQTYEQPIYQQPSHQQLGTERKVNEIYPVEHCLE